MSVTDGNIRRTYGNIQIPKTQVKRAYERLRKASYRRRGFGGYGHYRWIGHRAYVQGLRDMANAVTSTNRDGI